MIKLTKSGHALQWQTFCTRLFNISSWHFKLGSRGDGNVLFCIFKL